MNRTTQFPIETRLALGLVFALLAVGPAAAQTPAQSPGISEELLACAAIDDDVSRVACFDRTLAPLLGDAEGGTEDAAHAFAGNADWTSNIVEMAGPWHIAWRSTATLLSIEIRTGENVFVSVAGTQIGAGEGRSDTLDAGNYRISVTAIGGDWRLFLVED
jgi:hypothetical protein